MATPASVTLPGQTVTPSRYQDYMILYTEGDEVVAVVDGAPPGPDGRKFTVTPGKAIKVPWEAGRFILEHLAYTGVVRVRETDKADGTGTEYDIESAKAESLAAFEVADEKRWAAYVEYCVTDKINNKKAVPATPDSIKALIKRRGYRLSEFGITPVGESAPADNRIAELTKLVADLKAQLDDALGNTPPAKKGK